MKVLLTGSTGYIGRRLKEKLLEDKNIQLRLLVRNKKSISADSKNQIEITQGDTFNKESLKEALKGIDVAYYLIHSLSSENYKDLDKTSAQNFLDIACECGVKRVIYLGGLGVKDEHTSEHLLSRIETGEILSSNEKVQTIWIRAGVIIGSGSASFEIIRNLTEKLPIMTTPKWVNTKAQPIAVADVLSYLYNALHLDVKENLVVDIGSEQLSYKNMMLKTAKV
ncbi:MAG: NAD(P)H-binding protein, partial [Arcobacteraceae bacterium]